MDNEKVLDEEKFLPIEQLIACPSPCAPIGSISEVFLSDDEDDNLLRPQVRIFYNTTIIEVKMKIAKMHLSGF